MDANVVIASSGNVVVNVYSNAYSDHHHSNRRPTLNNETFVLFAARYYDNPNAIGTEEFFEDLKRFRYIKRLLNRFRETGDLKERLILNHIVIIFNVFESRAATQMLFMKLKGYEEYLKPFLVLLGRMPEKIDGKSTVDIILNPTIVEALRKI